MRKLYLLVLFTIGVLLLTSGCLTGTGLKKAAKCEEIQDQYNKDYCYYDAVRYGAGGIICTKIADQNMQNSCYFTAAKKEGNGELCEKIDYTELKEVCFAVVEKNVNACGKLNNEWKNRCYNDIALSKKDKSICGMIADEEERDHCIWDILFSLNFFGINREAICEELTNSKIKDLCYFDAANAEQNPAICEKITESDKKYNCLAINSRDNNYCNKIMDLDRKQNCHATLQTFD